MQAKEEILRKDAAVTTKEVASAHELEQEDRLSNLPDDILSFILEKLKLREAARTSILSRRWRDIFAFRSDIMIDLGSFSPKDVGPDDEPTLDDVDHINASVVEATKSMLANKNEQCHPINRLFVRYHLMEVSIDIIRCIDSAIASRRIAELEFVMCPEIMELDCTRDAVITYGRRFMKFFEAGPRAFAGLTFLHVQCVSLSVDDMVNVLNTCNKLELLHLHICGSGDRSALKIEHPKLVTIKLFCCGFQRVELTCLPRLTRVILQNWMVPGDTAGYPLSFGCVPRLLTLVLSNAGTISHRDFRLSELLNNTMIGLLDLDFACEKIWIQPEAAKLLRPCLQNLQILYLKRIHEECDLEWTFFILEAAPLLRKLHVQVWDHTSCGDEEDESREVFYEKKSNLLTWNSTDGLKHYSLKELTIKGYQDDDHKFSRFIRRVVEAAVNLELIILLSSGWCAACKFSPSTRYPRTEEERDLTRKQISQWRSSPIKIRFGP